MYSKNKDLGEILSSSQQETASESVIEGIKPRIFVLHEETVDEFQVRVGYLSHPAHGLAHTGVFERLICS